MSQLSCSHLLNDITADSTQTKDAVSSDGGRQNLIPYMRRYDVVVMMSSKLPVDSHI